MEGELKPQYLLDEVAGTPIEGIKMTESEAYYWHEYIDPQIDLLIANLELEKTRRKLSDAYQMRTIPGL